MKRFRGCLARDAAASGASASSSSSAAADLWARPSGRAAPPQAENLAAPPTWPRRRARRGRLDKIWPSGSCRARGSQAHRHRRTHTHASAARQQHWRPGSRWWSRASWPLRRPSWRSSHELCSRPRQSACPQSSPTPRGGGPHRWSGNPRGRKRPTGGWQFNGVARPSPRCPNCAHTHSANQDPVTRYQQASTHRKREIPAPAQASSSRHAPCKRRRRVQHGRQTRTDNSHGAISSSPVALGQ